MPATTGAFTHLDDHGRAQMVNVSSKVPTRRQARARARLVLDPATARRLREGELGAGEAVAFAKAAGMLAAKQTPSLVPLCHRILLDDVVVELAIEEDGVVIEAQVRTKDRTGVELEALTACLVAALSLFEAVKGEDPAARIEEATVLEKAGGASGTWRRREDGTLEHVPRGDDLGQEGRARRT